MRNKGDYGLDGDLDNLPRTLLGIGDIQIRRLKFTLFGTVQGRRFTRGPTSCSLKVSTGEGEAYDHPGFVGGPHRLVHADGLRQAAVRTDLRDVGRRQGQHR